MKVYRVEGPNGIGPYQNGLARPEHYDKPGPMDDGVFGDKYWEIYSTDPELLFQYNYGFPSKTKLFKWFDKSSLRSFAANDNHVYEYEVHEDKVLQGEEQCAFRKQDAYSSRRVPLKKLLH